jgi:hypothetical protein
MSTTVTPDAATAPSDTDSLLNAPADVFAKAFGLDTLLGTAPAAEAPAAEPETPGAEPAPEAGADPETPAPEAAAPAAAAAAAATELDETPEEPAPGKPAAAAPLTKFTALQAGEEVDVPSDLTFTFTANGKEYKDLPIDRVIRMAQSAGNNETLREQALQAEAAQLAAEEQLAQMQQDIQDRLTEADALIARLLTDDDYRDRARDRYARANSPEARAERAETELAETRRTQQQQTAAAQARSFTTEHLAPAMETLLTRHPTITPDELLGKFALLTRHMVIDGVIPPQRIPDVAKVFREKLVPWAGQTHEHRSVTAAQQQAATARAVQDAQTKATLAKRQLAKLTKPSASGALVTPAAAATAAPKPAVIESADDAVADIVRGVTSQLRG